jgi:hypothetical protein
MGLPVETRLSWFLHHHLDNFILTLNLSLICQISYSGSEEILHLGQLYHSPELVCCESFSAKAPGLVSADGTTNVYTLNHRLVIAN